MNQPHHNWIDFGAIATFVATVYGWVPLFLAPFTALATFFWAVGRVYEMFTGEKVHETKPVQAALKRLKAWRSG